MGQSVAISIEGQTTKIVLGSLRGQKVLIDEILEVDTSALRDYLKQIKAKKIYVHFDDKDLIEETFSLPPAKNKIIRNLINLELTKILPDSKDCLFWYVTYEQEISSTRQYFVIATDKANVQQLIEKVLEAGKIPERILPNYLPLLLLVPYSDKPFLLYFQKGNQRTILLVKEQRPLLVRTVAGEPEFLTSADIQHLNMTYNYCQQRLNLRPEIIYIVGSQKISQESTIFPVIPIATLYHHYFELPKSISVEEFKDFLLPAAIMLKSQKIKDLISAYLPQEYKFFRIVNSLLKVTILLFLTFSFISGIAAVRNFNRLTQVIEKARLSINKNQIHALYNEYVSLQNTLNSLKDAKKLLILYQNEIPPIHIISKLSTILDPAITLNSINIAYSDKDVIVQFSGTSNDKTKSAFLTHLDLIGANLKKGFNIQKLQSTYSVKERTFTFSFRLKSL